MKRSVILIVLLLAVSVGDVAAQSIVKDAIEINGLRVGTHYTREELFAALGQPTRTILPSYEDSYENSYIFDYGDDRFYWIDGVLYGFDLVTSSFALNGCIRVGDSVDLIDRLGGLKRVDSETLKIVNWRPSGGGLYDWLSVDFQCDARDRIIKILAFINDL